MLQPIEVLRQYWGYEAFRPPQQDIIQSVLQGHDTLALMPTGGGKSLCFQVPALCTEGTTIVISPLIALMKDQVERLRQLSIPAAAIFSGMAYRDIDHIFDNAVHGAIKLLYLSPERLATELAQTRIAQMRVSLLAVDEAHCISQWGYDFRPPYLQIAQLRRLIPNTPVLALTATATPQVIDDIQQRLEFRPNAAVFRKSFARTNLSYSVIQTLDKEAKLIHILQKVPGSAIVYVRNRRRAELIDQTLRQHQISSTYYHAGLTHQQRAERQESWLNNQIRVIVATNAFGMGIDKPNVRTVIHMDTPESPEAYFQEAGRAGRDGQTAYAVMLYHHSDRTNMERQYQQAYPSVETVQRVYQALGSYLQIATGAGEGQAFDFDLTTFAHKFQLDPLPTLHALQLLQQSGWIEMTEAVYIQPTVQILWEKQPLYELMIQQPALGAVANAILRLYQGAHRQPVPIRLQQIANFVKTTPAELQQRLQRLEHLRAITYTPLKEAAQIILLRPRTEAAHLTLDHDWLEFRKQRHRHRLDAMLNYAGNSTQCRSIQLLQYFHDSSPQPCGKCDVCLEQRRKQQNTPAASHQDLEKQLRQLLSNHPQGIQPTELLQHLHHRTHTQALALIARWTDDNLLIQSSDGRLQLIS